MSENVLINSNRLFLRAYENQLHALNTKHKTKSSQYQLQYHLLYHLIRHDLILG